MAKQAKEEPRVASFPMTVHTMRIGDGYVAVARIAGVQVRSNRGSSAAGSVRDLFNQLAQEHNINAGLGIDLALAGEDYSSIAADMPALDA